MDLDGILATITAIVIGFFVEIVLGLIAGVFDAPDAVWPPIQ